MSAGPLGQAASPGSHAAPFADQWRELGDARSQLCLGVAPSASWLGRWQLEPGVAGARRYCEILLTAAGESLAVVKIQVPFFARFGPEGLRLLRWFTDRLHESGTLILLDVKLGDADDTMDAYAELYLGPQSVLGGDAVTAQCYMGFKSLGPLLSRSMAAGVAVFVMVRTSNHAAEEVQQARLDRHTTAELIARLISDWNREHAPERAVGPVGAVVGARSPESGELYSLLPRSLVEVPGLGRRDRSDTEVLAAARQLGTRAMFTVTSGILRCGPDAGDLRSALVHWSGELSLQRG